MRKFAFYLLLIMFVSRTAEAQPNVFNKGINLTNWFQTSNATEIHFTKYTKEDFVDIKSLGVDVIRLPINLHSMTSGAPDYNLDPLFLSLLDQVVDWTEELEIHLILDNHTFNPSVDTEPSILNILRPVWKNMAQHFKDRSNLLYYEILNEPHGIDDLIWNSIQGSVIKTIREIDSVHTIIVGPGGFNSYHNLSQMPTYTDDNLIYTFHFYDPFIFTHQGASWVEPSMVPLANVPFPYSASNMPSMPPEFQGTWVGSSFNNYQTDGTVAKIKELMDIAVNFKNQRNVPLFCGEFGVLDHNAPIDDRVEWYRVVREYLEQNGIAWTTWDYHGGFGLFEKFGNGMFDHDLNVPLLQALGFNSPPQTEFVVQPDSSTIILYSDFIASSITSSSYTNGILNFYSIDSKNGSYSINWESPSQYDQIGFNFSPIKDISFIFENNYSIGFWVKSNNLEARFDIRFVDTKDNELDHPWRMGYRIDNSKVTFTGDWQYLEIPLTSFEELGSWDNAWYEPQGLFRWNSVDKFEIVDEHGALSGTLLAFDELKIYDPSVTSVNSEFRVNDFHLSQNYPNPFNPTTTIQYNIPLLALSGDEGQHVSLRIYDILGEEVAILVNEQQSPGHYTVKWNSNLNGQPLASGIYFYVLKTNNMQINRKMILLK